MLLAVAWAVGELFLHPRALILEMALTHGVLNCGGFAICGLAGWVADQQRGG